jgi:hypothetical protein
MKKYEVQHEMDDETTICTCDADESNDITFGVGIPWQVRLFLARHVTDILNAMETGERVQLPVHTMVMSFLKQKGPVMETVDAANLTEVGAAYADKYVDRYDLMKLGWKPPIMVNK